MVAIEILSIVLVIVINFMVAERDHLNKGCDCIYSYN